MNQWCMIKDLSLYKSVRKSEHPQHIPVVSVLGEHSTVQMCFKWNDWGIFFERNNQMQKFSQNLNDAAELVY